MAGLVSLRFDKDDNSLGPVADTPARALAAAPAPTCMLEATEAPPLSIVLRLCDAFEGDELPVRILRCRGFCLPYRCEEPAGCCLVGGLGDLIVAPVSGEAAVLVLVAAAASPLPALLLVPTPSRPIPCPCPCP